MKTYLYTRAAIIIFLSILTVLSFSVSEGQIFRSGRLRERLPEQPVQDRLKKIIGIVEQSIETVRALDSQGNKNENAENVDNPNQGDFFGDIRLLMQAMRIVFHDSEDTQWGLSREPELNRWVITSTELAEPGSGRSEFFISRNDAETRLAGFYEPNGAVFAALLDFELNENQSERLSELFESLYGPKRVEPDSFAPEFVPQESNLLDEIENENFEFTGLFEKTVPPNAWENIETADFLALVAPFLHDVAQNSIKSGKIDVALTISSEGTVLGAAEIPDPAPIFAAKEKFLELLAKMAAEDTEKTSGNDSPQKFVYTKNEIESVDGFELTSIALPSAEVPGVFFGDTEFAKLLLASNRYGEGETEVIIGIRKDTACFAVGPAGTVGPALRRAIRGMRSPDSTPRTFFVFSAYEFRKLLADAIGENPGQAFRRSLTGNLEEGIKLSGSAEYGPRSCRIELSLHGRMVPFITDLIEYRFVAADEGSEEVSELSIP